MSESISPDTTAMLAQSHWIDRTTRGPAKEFLDRVEFRQLFGLSDEALNQLHAYGHLPDPLRPTKRTVKYTFEHAIMLALWLKLGGQITETATPPEVSLPSPGLDQSSAG